MISAWKNLDLEHAARFTFSAVIRERVEYHRLYQLPFNMVSFIVDDNSATPSRCDDLGSNESIILKPGLVFFTPVQTPLRLSYTAGNDHIGIHFRLERFPGLDVFTGSGGRHCFFDPKLCCEAEKLMTEPNATKALAQAQELALRVALRFWPQEPPPEHYREIARLEPLLKHIRDNISAKLNVDELADFSGCSASHLSREFQRVIGMSPKVFLQKELFFRASFELRDPEHSVKEIAADLGFSSAYNFSHFFKRLSGCSPKNFRSIKK